MWSCRGPWAWGRHSLVYYACAPCWEHTHIYTATIIITIALRWIIWLLPSLHVLVTHNATHPVWVAYTATVIEASLSHLSRSGIQCTNSVLFYTLTAVQVPDSNGHRLPSNVVTLSSTRYRELVSILLPSPVLILVNVPWLYCTALVSL